MAHEPAFVGAIADGGPVTVAVKEIGTPSPAGLTELVKVVVLLLMVTGTIELPVGTAAPSVTFVAVKVILPTELLVTVKVIRP